MCVNSESISNEIDESELQSKKHDEQMIWTWRGIDTLWLRSESFWGFIW
jgi:hypothetical protein